VKFTIEIYASASDVSGAPLHRTTISVINPLRAQKEAHHLLAAWKKRGAKSVRVLNRHGETLFISSASRAARTRPTPSSAAGVSRRCGWELRRATGRLLRARLWAIWTKGPKRRKNPTKSMKAKPTKLQHSWE
jgi:hypothetical protein